MAALATQKLALPSITPTFAAAAGGGDTCEAGDNKFLVVKNGGGGSINVTLAAFPDTTPYGAAIPDHIVAVPNGQERWIGPLNGSVFQNPSTGSVGISYSGVTSVTVGVFSF